MTEQEQVPQTTDQHSRPVWAAWLAFGILLFAFVVHMLWTFNSELKSLIVLEGVLFFSVSVLTAITRNQIAELYRRHYQRLAERAVFGAFFSLFGGTEVSLIHRMLAVNFVFVTALWSMVCFAKAVGLF